MNITKISIEKPIGIFMIVIFFIVLGLYSYAKIGVELLPSLNVPFVTVNVEYKGASAESVEQQIIKPMEDALSSVSHLKKMTSVAKQGQALITLELDLSTNADFAAIEATKKINAIRKDLPAGVEEPVVIKRDASAEPIMEIAIIAPYSLSDIYSKVDNVFLQQLQQSGGISEITIQGGRDKELAVLVKRDRLNYYDISLNSIITQLKNENLLLPTGLVYTEKMESDVRVVAQFVSPEELKQIQIKNAKGRYIPLTEVADISSQEKRETRISRVNGQDTISLSVYKNSDANIVTTVDGVKKQLQKLSKEYTDYDFMVISDQSTYINNALENTLGSLTEGLFTTGLVLFLFLRGWKSSLAVMIAIPASLISTFFMMYMAGFTFNMMSLMGMTLCIGVLVDDSIVVLENIHRFLAKGLPVKDAAEKGRNEIGMAALAITLCDIVVFLPIAFMDGMTGQFFRQFGLTIVFATLFSLFISFTLTPMIATKLFKNGFRSPQGEIWTLLNDLEQATTKNYERYLRLSLEHGKKILLVGSFVFIMTLGLIPSGLIGAEYMPQTDEGSFRIMAELPVGYNVAQTSEMLKAYEGYLDTLPEVRHYLSSVDLPSNVGRISVQLTNKGERSRSVWEITEDVRNFSKKALPDIKLRVNEAQSSVAGVSSSTSESGPSAPVQVELRGSDMDTLIAASNQVQSLLKETAGMKDVKSTYNEGVPEKQLTINRNKLKYYDATLDDVNNAFAAAITGKTAGNFANDVNNNGQDTEITVRFKDSSGFKTSDLRLIPVVAGNKTIFLGDVATITESVGPINIRRTDKQRSITVFGNITDRSLNEVLEELRDKLDQNKLDVEFRFAGQADSMRDTFREMLIVLGMSLLLIYILLAVLYESFSTPLIRMFSLPLGLIGSLIFLLLTNNTINLYSLIGILVMDGVVAKNGTLLLDYTLTLMAEGKSAKDAVIEAGKARLKPIFMTTITMIVGMLPTALAMAEGAETRSGMAWVIIGGLITSTVFTLVVIPIIFLKFEKLKSRWGSRSVINSDKI